MSRIRDVAPRLELDTGWERIDASMWRSLVHRFADAGEEWPEGMCLLDLRIIAKRVLMGTVSEMPSCRSLAARWGTSQHRARRIMHKEALWVNPEWADERNARKSDEVEP